MVVKVGDIINKKSTEKNKTTEDTRPSDSFDKNNKVEETTSNILRIQNSDNNDASSAFSEYITTEKDSKIVLDNIKKQSSTFVEYGINDSDANCNLDKSRVSNHNMCSFERRCEANITVPNLNKILKTDQSPEPRVLTRKRLNTNKPFSLMKLLKVVRERSSLDSMFKFNNNDAKQNSIENSKIQPTSLTRGPMLPHQRHSLISNNCSSRKVRPRTIKFTVRHASESMKDEDGVVTEFTLPNEPFNQKSADKRVPKDKENYKRAPDSDNK